jgi:DNA-binding winged helix-turn-helix (wHTH) protein/TolB-like protein/Tfp pilus assembly protein PilF
MTASPRFSFVFQAFRLDPVEKVLFRDDVPVSLTPKAFETLLALVERPGQLVTKEELLRIVWPGTFVEENNLAQNISTLRRALGENAAEGQLIETVPKRGYRFVAPVEKRLHEQDVAVPAAVVIEAAPARNLRLYGAVLGMLALVVLAAAIVAWSRAIGTSAGDGSGGEAAGVTRLAVLPFVNLGSAEEEYFAAGMTEEITGRLAGLRRIAVASSTTATGYDRRGKTVPQIGSDLGVDYIVEGSVRWSGREAGPQVRITPKLIRVADDTTVWTQQYDAPLSDLFGVQADIAYRITGALQVALEARERRLVDARPTADHEAYLAYLRGVTTIQQSATDTGNQVQARAELETAVARDPRFAVAWGWLARVYAWQYNSGALRQPETREAARRAAQTAMALNPALPEAHLGLAQVFMIERDFEPALRELHIARGGLPNSPEVLRMIAWVEQRKGRWADSLDAYMRAFDVDPVATAEPLAIHYMHMRQFRETDRFIGILRAANRPTASLHEAWVRFSERGDVATARRWLESSLDGRPQPDARIRGLLARLEWVDGRYERALELIDGMDASGAWMTPNFRYPASLLAGQVYETMGRREDAATRYAAAMATLEARLRDAPDDYQIEAALGLAAAGLGRSADAIRHAERAVELLPVSKDAAEGPLYLYLLAQVQAKIGQSDAAFATLDRMLGAPGFWNEIWVQHDPSFASLKRDPSFRSRVERWSRQKGDVLLKRQTE